MMAGVQYYLNDTTPSDPLTGGVCVTQCMSNLYGNATTASCKVCDPMCLSCHNSPSNCTQCTSYNSIKYYLQPAATSCLLTCPVGYYPNPQTFTCDLCDSRCASCTGPSNDSCTSCQKDSNNVPYYLVADSTNCSNVCTDAKTYANSTTYKC